MPRVLVGIGDVQRFGGKRVAFAVKARSNPVTLAPASTKASAVA